MCEYCEKEKPINDEIDKKIQILKNTMLVRRKLGNVFDAIICNTTFNINYCPMCRKEVKLGGNMSLDINITAKREVEIYESNVTYNLADMYYKCIDKDKGFKKLDGMNCKEALPIINNAIQDMLNNANEYRKLNPKNGWGSYERLLTTLQDMRYCCENNSDGTINVS